MQRSASSHVENKNRLEMTMKRSLKITENGTIGKHGYGFLFPFHSNYGRILYHFRDTARYWLKIVIFSYPCIYRPR